MANLFSDISPNIDKTQETPNFEGRSKGFTPDSVATAVAIKGGADVLGMKIQAKDQYLKDTIEEQATAAVDRVRDDFIEDARAKRDLPQPLITSLRDIEKLTASNRQGRTKDSTYFAKLDDISRQLNTRYPGYRQEIDQSIRKLVGVTPANALVNAVAAEADKAAASRSGNVSQRYQFFKSEGKYIPKAAFDAEGTPNQWSMFDLLEATSNLKRSDQEVARAKATVELTNARLATKSATINIAKGEQGLVDGQLKTLHNTELNKAYIETLNPYTPALNKLASEGAEQFKANGRISPDTVAALTQTVNAAKAEYQRKAAELLPKYSNVDSAVLKANSDNYTAMLDNFIKGVTDGTLSGNATIVKSVMENAQAAFVANDRFAAISAVSKMHGPAAAERMIFRGRKGIEGYAEELASFQDVLARTMIGRSTPEQTITESRIKGIPPVKTSEMLRTTAQTLSSAETTPEGFDSVYRSTFSDPSYIGRVTNNAKDARNLFSLYTTPAIANSIVKRSAELNNPYYKDNYVRWANDAAMRIFRTELGGVDDIAKENLDWNVVWNDKTKSLEGVPLARTPEGLRTLDRQRTFINASLTGANEVISSVLPVWEANGLDPKAEVTKILGESLDTLNTKSPGLLKTFRDWIKPREAQVYRFEGGSLNASNIEDFLKDIQGVRTPEREADAESLISGIQEVLGRYQFVYEPTPRESTNVEDVRESQRSPVGRFAEPSLLDSVKF